MRKTYLFIVTIVALLGVLSIGGWAKYHPPIAPSGLQIDAIQAKAKNLPNQQGEDLSLVFPLP
jgi:uncharacterized membrane protein